MQIKLLSVIVPIYKKEKTIKKELLSIYKLLKSTPYNFEIIGIVDGMLLDNSYTEAKTLNINELKIFGYETNRGKGQAVRYGMQKAQGDVIVFVDSGGDINPQGIIILIEHMKWYNADVIIGSKTHPASKVSYPLKRKILSVIYYYFVKIFFGLKVRDTQTGLKAYKRQTLEKVLDKMVVKRFAFDIEILAVAYKFGFKRIYDAPVEVKLDFSKSSIIGIFSQNGLWKFIYDTLAVWYRIYILHYYDDGRKRVKVYDKELDMYINTGDMTDKHQIIIDFINSIVSSIRSIIRKDGRKK